MVQENEELLTLVDKEGEPTGEYVSRKDFYDGKCANKRICGVVFWIFDKEGNLLLAERATDKEQGAGKISPPSGHVQYIREEVTGEKERPIQACFNEIAEEIGLSWNYENFPFTDDYFPIGVIQQPGGSAENCEMLVKHYALLIADDAKSRIKNNEAKRIFFESWDTASEKFGIDDNTQGAYKFFGTNKTEILYELDGFAYKVEHLDKLGQGATWDTIALNDWDAVEGYRKGKEKRPENREGYVTWEIISSRDDLWYIPEVESMIVDTITTREDISFEDIKDIIRMTSKNITTNMVNGEIVASEKEHTGEEFSEVIAPQSKVNNIIDMTRNISRNTNQNDKDKNEGHTM